MWLKWPGIFMRHFSQSARYPMLNDFFMPGWSVQVLTVCLLRQWPNLLLGEGEVDAEVGLPVSASVIPASASASETRGGVRMLGWRSMEAGFIEWGR